MRVVAYLLAAVLGLLGFVFLAGNQGVVLRIVVGVVLILSGGALVIAVRLRPQVYQRTIVQNLNLTGDVSLEAMTCNACGGQLSRESVSIQAGAAFVSCPFCQASYQLEEAPKW